MGPTKPSIEQGDRICTSYGFCRNRACRMADVTMTYQLQAVPTLRCPLCQEPLTIKADEEMSTREYLAQQARRNRRGRRRAA